MGNLMTRIGDFSEANNHVELLRKKRLYAMARLKERFPEVKEADIKEALRQCDTFEGAITFLNRECQLCYNFVPQTKMTAMLTCEHMCCDNCAANYFKVQIKEKRITEAKCPYCDEPKDEEMLQNHFMWLGETLKSLLKKGLLEDNIVTLFDKKVAADYLEKDPLFRWCSQCDNGMLMDDATTKTILCINCNKETCCECHQPWQGEHKRMSCKEFAQWKRDNGAQHFDVEKQLKTEGIQCPKCNEQYLLSRGGCLHFKCPNCAHEFCSGCDSEFSQGAACKEKTESCRRLGMHAHHPSTCFYYLRDKEIWELESILDGNNIAYDHIHFGNRSLICPIITQKEVGYGWKDEQCGEETHKNASFCKYHYAERLCLLMKGKNVDTLKRGRKTPVVVKDSSNFLLTCILITLCILFISCFFPSKYWNIE